MAEIADSQSYRRITFSSDYILLDTHLFGSISKFVYLCRMKKVGELGYGYAYNQLRKTVMFELAKRLGLDVCFQCKKRIETVSEFSVEHKIPWLHSGKEEELFNDLDNIAFSHLKCNILAKRPRNEGKKKNEHPSRYHYAHNICRCDECKMEQAKYSALVRARNKGKPMSP